MIEKISNKLLNMLINGKDVSEEKREILLFGITRFVEDIPKFIGIIIISIYLNILYDFLIITAVLMLYKTFVGGVHVKTNIGCFIYSVLFYLAITYSAKYILFNPYEQNILYILIYIFSIYIIVVYAPADVPEIPKINENLRNSLKIKSFLSLNLLYVITCFIKDIEIINLILYSIFFTSLMTTRIVYKLFKMDYGYETYIPYDNI